MENNVAFPSKPQQTHIFGPEVPLEGMHSILRHKSVHQKVHRECSEQSWASISK